MFKISWNHITKDLLAILLLLIVFSPLYLFNLYLIPYQINADEIILMGVAKSIAYQHNVDIFGLSGYFAHPNLFFYLFGNLGRFLGGVNLANMRLIHAIFGLGGILASYFFFRALGKKVGLSLMASCILGSNHAFLAISRMAMRDNNMPLLLESLSLGLAFLAYKKHNIFLSILAGIFAGLAFYSYLSARLIVIVGGLFLLRKPKLLIGYLLTTIVIALPVIFYTISDFDQATEYPRAQLLIFEEGRLQQKGWVAAKTVQDGLKINITDGLTVFNNNIVDNGWHYPNYNHGFTDHLTGVFIWVGVFLLLVKLIHRKLEAAESLILLGLLVELFIFSFIINKAPEYTRLLIILPFAAFLAAYVINQFKTANHKLELTVKGAIVLLILLLNLNIFADFVMKGLKGGDDIGSTGRYVDSKSNIAGYTFYLVYDQKYPYYSYAGHWHDFFVGSKQTSQVLSSDNFTAKLTNKPFTVFMNKQLWIASEPQLRKAMPDLKLINIKPDGSLVAIEVK